MKKRFNKVSLNVQQKVKSTGLNFNPRENISVFYKAVLDIKT